MRFSIAFRDVQRPQVDGSADQLSYGRLGVFVQFVHKDDTGSDFYPYSTIQRISKYPTPEGAK